MRPEPRPELAVLPSALHGGSHDPSVLDFSTGVSPLAPPDELIAAFHGANLSRYPHPTALPVREAISELHDVPADGIVVGAGSVELIWSLARAFAGPGRRGLVVSPAFGEYEQALKASGSSVVEVKMQAPRFDLPCDVLEARLAEAPIAVVFICRPSNPCLTVPPAETLAALARRWPGVLFVIDEAYLPMFDGIGALPPGPNVAVLRSLTKLFALPGLRLGYMLAPAPIAHAVQAALPPWNVSSPAQAVGIVAASVLPSVVAPIRARIAALRSSLHAAPDRYRGYRRAGRRAISPLQKPGRRGTRRPPATTRDPGQTRRLVRPADARPDRRPRRGGPGCPCSRVARLRQFNF